MHEEAEALLDSLDVWHMPTVVVAEAEKYEQGTTAHVDTHM
jgi:hypothetical protein